MTENTTTPIQGISASTIARTVCLLLALINQVLAVLGYSPIDIADETINQLISVGFTIVTALIAWWKDNPFTKKARVVEEFKKQLG